MAITTFSHHDIDQMDQRFRVKFINSLSGIKSANLIGTVDSEGNENLSIVSSCVHLGANPSLMGMVIRPRKAPRHSLENIQEMKCWTINHIHADFAKASHQTSARYPKEVSEFAAAGIEPEYLGDFSAPFVKGSPLKLAMELVEILPLSVNQTEFVIGAIREVHFDDSALAEDGHIDLTQLGSLGVCGLDHYVQMSSLFRLSYAKTDKEVRELDQNGE